MQAAGRNASLLIRAIVCLALLVSASAESTCDSHNAAAAATRTLVGHRVVVTGGSKGIGKGMAAVFARAGAKVLIVGRTRAALEAAAAEINSATGREDACDFFVGDVSKEEDVERVAEAAKQKLGGLDVLCANAGVFPQTKLEDMAVAEWDEVMATNLRGTFLSCKALLGMLKLSTTGRIILTSSITGPHTGYPGWTHYGASKAGQLGFMRTAALEFAKYSITVNAILPGNIETEALSDLGEDYIKGMVASIPMGRLGSVEDIGHAAVFLASPQAGFITGQTLVVDGGQTLPESPEAMAEV